MPRKTKPATTRKKVARKTMPPKAKTATRRKRSLPITSIQPSTKQLTATPADTAAVLLNHELAINTLSCENAFLSRQFTDTADAGSRAFTRATDEMKADVLHYKGACDECVSKLDKTILDVEKQYRIFTHSVIQDRDATETAAIAVRGGNHSHQKEKDANANLRLRCDTLEKSQRKLIAATIASGIFALLAWASHLL